METSNGRKTEVRVLLIAAMTLCGRISPAPLGSGEDRRFLEEMRMKTDASLIGAGTVRAENPTLCGSDGVPPVGRMRAIISTGHEVPMHERAIFSNGPPPHLFAPFEQVAALKREAGAKAVVHGLPWWREGELSLRACLQIIATYGVHTLLVEGGGKLFRSVFAQGLADELFVTLVPRLSADRHAAQLVPGGDPLGHPLLHLRLLSCQANSTGEVFLRYAVDGNADQAD